MRTRPRPAPAIGGLVLVLLLAAPWATAAQGIEPRYRNVISANPFGLLLEFFNAEYERVFSHSVTAGFGGSFVDLRDDNYLNADVFARYYPQGRAVDGWAFGGKLGMTRVEKGNYFGFGFDVNRSWLLGTDDNFYVGLGFGLKRLLGVRDDADFDVRFIPTIRIINVGFAF